MKSIYFPTLAIEATPSMRHGELRPNSDIKDLLVYEYAEQCNHMWWRVTGVPEFGNVLLNDTLYLDAHRALNRVGVTNIDVVTCGGSVSSRPGQFPDREGEGTRIFNGNVKQLLDFDDDDIGRVYDGIYLNMKQDHSINEELVASLFERQLIHPIASLVLLFRPEEQPFGETNLALRSIFNRFGYTCAQPRHFEDALIYRLVNMRAIRDPESPYKGLCNSEDAIYIDAWLSGRYIALNSIAGEQRGPHSSDYAGEQEEEVAPCQDDVETTVEDSVPGQHVEDHTFGYNENAMGVSEREFFSQFEVENLCLCFELTTLVRNPSNPDDVNTMVVARDAASGQPLVFHKSWLRYEAGAEPIPHYRWDVFPTVEALLELPSQEEGMRYVRTITIEHEGRSYAISQLRYGDPMDFYSWDVVAKHRLLPLRDLIPCDTLPATGTPIVYKQLRGECDDFFKAYYQPGMCDKVYEFYTLPFDRHAFYYETPRDIPDALLLGHSHSPKNEDYLSNTLARKGAPRHSSDLGHSPKDEDSLHPHTKKRRRQRRTRSSASTKRRRQ